MPSKPWTREEVRYLRDWWGELSDWLLARRLSRTVVAVRSKRRQLGLRRKKWRPWTAEDDETLHRVYSIIGPGPTARLLDRTLSACYDRASQLGVKAPGRRMWTTRDVAGLRRAAEVLAEQFGRSPLAVLAKLQQVLIEEADGA